MCFNFPDTRLSCFLECIPTSPFGAGMWETNVHSPPLLTNKLILFWYFKVESCFQKKFLGFLFSVAKPSDDEIAYHWLKYQCWSALGKRQHFSHDFVPPTKEGIFPCSYSQGGGALQIQAVSPQRGMWKKEAFFFFFKSSELCYHRQVSPTVSYISFLGKEHWASAIAEACALLINCCFRRVEAPRGNTHSRWHLKVFLFYRDFRLLTL